MKTTIELPDALKRDAKELARQEGTTLRELMVAGLRTEIESRSSGVRPQFRFPTMAGQGLVPDLDAASVIAQSSGRLSG